MINVAYVSNSEFFVPLTVSIKSLLENNKEVSINVFENNFSDSQKETLKQIVGNYDCKIIFYNISNELKIIDGIAKTDANWNLTYAKIFIANKLDDLDRVLFIDADTVIDGDIFDFYNIEFENNVVAVVDEITTPDTKLKVGLKEEDNYFNAGVILINAKKWRELGIENKCIDFINEKNGVVHYMDQGTMNNLLSKRAVYVHPKYNVTSQMLMKRKGKPFVNFEKGFYKPDEYKNAIDTPVIIHYTGMFGCHPWNEYCVHVKKDRYEYYLSLLPDSVSRKKNKMSKIYFVLTRLYYNVDSKTFDVFNKIVEKIRSLKNGK